MPHMLQIKSQGDERKFQSPPISTDFFRNIYCILGVPFDAVTLPQAAEIISNSAQRGERCFLSTPNVNFLIACRSDTAFRDSILRSDLSVADGMPIIWIGRLLGADVPERVAGSSLFELICDLQHKISVYFFGGPEGAAEEASQALNAQSKAVHCVGFQSPGFGSVEELSKKDMIAHINSCKPDFLIVAAGAKKGQEWIMRNWGVIETPVVSHLGAVVNLVAGRIARAPLWMQNMGLEWLWRITQEPRLWSRYATDGLLLGRLVLTRTIPALLKMRLVQVPQEQFESANVHLNIGEIQAQLVLKGAWCSANAGPLRLAFARATAFPRDITLDLNEVCFMDSACIALLALLYGHQVRFAQHWHPIQVGVALRRCFHAHCVEYLLIERKADE